MIRSRRFVTAEDAGRCCARCSRLSIDGKGAVHYVCRIDGAAPEAPDLISICICNKYQEVKKNG